MNVLFSLCCAGLIVTVMILVVFWQLLTELARDLSEENGDLHKE